MATKKRKTTTRRSTSRKKRAEQRLPAGLGTLFAGLLLVGLAFVEGDSVWKTLHQVLFGLFGCGSFVLGAAVCCLAVLYTRGEDLLPHICKLALGLVFASGTVIVFSDIQPQGLSAFQMVAACYQNGYQAWLSGGALGAVLGGKLLTGYTGAASEAGHMVIADTPDAPLCTCGRRGCLEALASATALIRMTREARRTHPESLLNALAPTEADVNGRTVFDAAAQGDTAAKAVADTYIHHLAVGVANLINIFFPEVIGLSGGVANQGENLLKPLRAAAAPMVFGSAFAKKHTRITTCTLGYRAGVIGAALLAKQEV